MPYVCCASSSSLGRDRGKEGTTIRRNTKEDILQTGNLVSDQHSQVLAEIWAEWSAQKTTTMKCSLTVSLLSLSLSLSLLSLCPLSLVSLCLSLSLSLSLSLFSLIHTTHTPHPHLRWVPGDCFHVEEWEVHLQEMGEAGVTEKKVRLLAQEGCTSLGHCSHTQKNK